MKIVIITGPTGSGKTTFANALFDNLKYAFILRTDNYYKTGFISNLFSYFVNAYFDKPLSLNKNLIQKDINAILKNKYISKFYKYDFIRKKRIKVIKDISRIDFLIIEGIFALEIIKYIENKDYILVNLKTSKKDCRDRISLRDIIERGKSEKEYLKDFFNAWNIYKEKERNFNFKNIKKLITLKRSFDIDKILKMLSTKSS